MIQQQAFVESAGILLAICGIILALWFFRRGGGRKTRVRVSMTIAGKSAIEKVLRERPLLQDCKIFRLTISNLGPSDVQISKATDVEWRSLRPHLDVPLGYWIVHITRLGVRSEEPDLDFDLPLARYPFLPRNLLNERQKIYIHIHRLRAGRRSRIYLACRQINDEAIAFGGPPWPFELFPGWVQNVNVRGGYDSIRRCDGSHQD
jgi:hypothetical protein